MDQAGRKLTSRQAQTSNWLSCALETLPPPRVPLYLCVKASSPPSAFHILATRRRVSSLCYCVYKMVILLISLPSTSPLSYRHPGPGRALVHLCRATVLLARLLTFPVKPASASVMKFNDCPALGTIRTFATDSALDLERGLRLQIRPCMRNGAELVNLKC